MSARRLFLCMFVAATLTCGGQPGRVDDDTRVLVRLLLGGLSLDSLCGCEHVVIDPVVKKVDRGFIAPPLEADTLLTLSSEDLRMIRGAASVKLQGYAQWPYSTHPAQDTLALAIYEVDSVPSLRNERYFAVVVIPPGASMRGWSWTAFRVDGRWRACPLALHYEP